MAGLRSPRRHPLLGAAPPRGRDNQVESAADHHPGDADRRVAPWSHRSFQTDALAEERNYQGLARLNTELVQREASGTRRVTLDIDSSESPVHGAQGQSAYNGHFESVCHHPLFVFNQDGDCLAAAPAGQRPQCGRVERGPPSHH